MKSTEEIINEMEDRKTEITKSEEQWEIKLKKNNFSIQPHPLQLSLDTSGDTVGDQVPAARWGDICNHGTRTPALGPEFLPSSMRGSRCPTEGPPCPWTWGSQVQRAWSPGCVGPAQGPGGAPCAAESRRGSANWSGNKSGEKKSWSTAPLKTKV